MGTPASVRDQFHNPKPRGLGALACEFQYVPPSEVEQNYITIPISEMEFPEKPEEVEKKRLREERRREFKKVNILIGFSECEPEQIVTIFS